MTKIKLLLLLFLTNIITAQQDKSIIYSKGKFASVISKYSTDPEKLKAVNFLLDNMDIHYSQNYKWSDEHGNDVPFNELNYPNIELAVEAFQKLKDSIKITPHPYKVMDLQSLTPELLIKNIELAFEVWKNNPWSRSYDFTTFCEYILPYRSLIEPLEDWREDYAYLVNAAAIAVPDQNDPINAATQTILALRDFRFLDSRPDPIPFLSPKQLLFRREGACNDLANLTLMACRSKGLAVTFDFTPYYGASSKKHFWNTIITKNSEHVPFNGNCFGNPKGLPYAYNATEKRLAKVFRYTYSKQGASLASIIDDNAIPDGFLKEKNIIDVTSEYVSTGNITYSTTPQNKEAIGYLNVFNLGKWRTVDWGKKNGTSIYYKRAGVNIVYLPSIYNTETRKMKYASYPVLLDSNKKQNLLKPDYTKTFSYDLTRDKNEKKETLDFNSFEIFEGQIYTLLVWDNGWKKIEESVAANNSVHFSKIPKNGLFLSLCKKSNGYERIFFIDPISGHTIWY